MASEEDDIKLELGEPNKRREFYAVLAVSVKALFGLCYLPVGGRVERFMYTYKFNEWQLDACPLPPAGF